MVQMDTTTLQAMQPLPTMLLFILSLLFLLGVLVRSRRRPPYPPGPKGLPLIGNMLTMDKLTHRGLAQLAKQYGGLLHLQLGVVHMVAVSTAEMAHKVLQVQDSAFANRPTNIAISYLTYDRADMAFAPYGPFWRQMRKICVMRLFSRKRAESWESVRDEVESTIRTVADKAGSAVNVGELVFGLTKSIVFRAAFGSDSRDRQDEFVSIMQEFSKLFGAFNIADFIPWFGWVDPQGLNKRLVKARRSLDGFIDRIIDDHIEKKRINDGARGIDQEADMVDELLVFYREDTKKDDSNDLQSTISLTRDNIKAIIMDVMFGGTETVASAIDWTMSELMKYPEDMKRVQQELADVLGLDRRVQESDMDKLIYLKCVIKETLRLHPPIPLLLHESVEDCEVTGYWIPARSRVLINAFAIGRDKAAWDDPETFKPSRFMKEGAVDFRGSNFEFIPFGSGRRSCPGMQLGLYALELSVAHLIHSFSWELADGMKPSELDMSDVFGLTAPRAIPLMAVPSPRLLCSLF